MNKKEYISDDLILEAFSLLSRAKSTSRTSKFEAMKYLKAGVKRLRLAIELEPENIANRLTRARHMLEVTKESPCNYISIVNIDLNYLEDNFYLLNDNQKCLFYNIKGDLSLFNGEHEIGSSYYKECLSFNSDSTMADYAINKLESLS